MVTLLSTTVIKQIYEQKQLILGKRAARPVGTPPHAIFETQVSLYMINHSVLETLAWVRADYPAEANPQACLLRVTNQQVDDSLNQYVRSSFKHKATLRWLEKGLVPG